MFTSLPLRTLKNQRSNLMAIRHSSRGVNQPLFDRCRTFFKKQCTSCQQMLYRRDQVIGSLFFERLLRALREQSIPFDFHASSILADGRTTTVQERMVLLVSPKARGIIITQNRLTTSCQTSTGNQTHVTRRRNETNSLTRPSHKRRQMLIMHQRNHQTSQHKRANHLMGVWINYLIERT
jgi:hypothetical protein